MTRERERAACEGSPVLRWPGAGGLDEGEVRKSKGLGPGSCLTGDDPSVLWSCFFVSSRHRPRPGRS